MFILRKRKYPTIQDSKLPFISVLIPARNEEINIKNVTLSLLEQDYPNYEVIVLNDNSEDKTNEKLNEIKSEYPQLKVIQGKLLAEGWTGKCYACKQLADEAKGDWFLFTDADTTHNKNSLRRSIEIAVNRKADMLTLFPQFTMVTFAEKLIMPLLKFTILVLLPLWFVDKKGFTKFSIGIGPFMMFRKEAYEKIGGHESVKDAIVEDVWLGRKIKENNLRLIAEDGMKMLSVRMYRNFKEIWDGFSKNIFPGFAFDSIVFWLIQILYFALFILPFVLFAKQLFLYNINTFFYLTAIQVGVLLTIRLLIAQRFRLGYLSSILHPFGAFVVTLISFNSWRWIVSGSGSKWKGRVYKSK